MLLKNVLMDSEEKLYIDFSDLVKRIEKLEQGKHVPVDPDPDPEPETATDYSIIFVNHPNMKIGSYYKFYAWELCLEEKTDEQIDIEGQQNQLFPIYHWQRTTDISALTYKKYSESYYDNWWYQDGSVPFEVLDRYYYGGEGTNNREGSYIDPLEFADKSSLYKTSSISKNVTRTKATRKHTGIYVYTIVAPTETIQESDIYFTGYYDTVENYQFNNSGSYITEGNFTPVKSASKFGPFFWSYSDNYYYNFYPTKYYYNTGNLSGGRTAMYLVDPDNYSVTVDKKYSYFDSKLCLNPVINTKSFITPIISYDKAYAAEVDADTGKLNIDTMTVSDDYYNGCETQTYNNQTTERGISASDYGLREAYEYTLYDFGTPVSFMYSEANKLNQCLFVDDDNTVKMCLDVQTIYSTTTQQSYMASTDKYIAKPGTAQGYLQNLLSSKKSVVVYQPFGYSSDYSFPFTSSVSGYTFVRCPSKDKVSTLGGYIKNYSGTLANTESYDTYLRRYYTSKTTELDGSNSKYSYDYYFD